MAIACGINYAAVNDAKYWPLSIEAIVVFVADTNAYQIIDAANDNAKFLAIT